MKKFLKPIILLTLLFITIIQYNAVYATQEGTLSLDKVISGADQALEDSKKSEGGMKVNKTELRQSSARIYNALFAIGVAITLIVGGILGIKFMVASVEDKAKIKEMLIPYIVGCVVIYGAFAIWKITVEVLSTV